MTHTYSIERWWEEDVQYVNSYKKAIQILKVTHGEAMSIAQKGHTNIKSHTWLQILKVTHGEAMSIAQKGHTNIKSHTW